MISALRLSVWLSEGMNQPRWRLHRLEGDEGMTSDLVVVLVKAEHISIDETHMLWCPRCKARGEVVNFTSNLDKDEPPITFRLACGHSRRIQWGKTVDVLMERSAVGMVGREDSERG